MKHLVTLIILIFSYGFCIAQTGVKTEQYQAAFEKKQAIDALPEYTDTIKIPVQLLKIGINEELYEMYPELKDKRVGLGVTNIVLEYLEYTNRFVFTEDKLEIKERMISQFKASEKGFTENKMDGRGKVKLAKYFVYIEVYDFSVSEDEVVKISGSSGPSGNPLMNTMKPRQKPKFGTLGANRGMNGMGLGPNSVAKPGVYGTY